jgi:hypothetical protein
MSFSTVTVGTLVFLGPKHVHEFTEFHYVRVVSVNGSAAQVSLIVPGAANEDIEDEIPLKVLQQRQVSDEEAGLWPGTYVGHPIAFVETDGPARDLWAYGLVTVTRWRLLFLDCTFSVLELTAPSICCSPSTWSRQTGSTTLYRQQRRRMWQ